jgi:hypothetical protein
MLAGCFLMVAAAGNAAALGYDDILGNWCGSKSNPNWTNFHVSRGTLAITHLPDGNTIDLSIDHFEFSDSGVVIYYLSAGHGNQASTPGSVVSRVQFIRFSPDRQLMIQATSDISGEYQFRRCQ